MLRIAATKTAAIRTSKAIKTAKTNTVITMAATTKKSKSRIPAPTQKALDTLSGPSNTDILGRYTGKPKSKGEKPVQDADDL